MRKVAMFSSMLCSIMDGREGFRGRIPGVLRVVGNAIWCW